MPSQASIRSPQRCHRTGELALVPGHDAFGVGERGGGDRLVAAASLAAGYDFSPMRTVADIGGGKGTLLAAVLRAHRHLRGVLVDRPPGVADAAQGLRAAGVADRSRSVVRPEGRRVGGLGARRISPGGSGARAYQAMRARHRQVARLR